jgi:hypothetical protein
LKNNELQGFNKNFFPIFRLIILTNLSSHPQKQAVKAGLNGNSRRDSSAVYYLTAENDGQSPKLSAKSFSK